MLLFSLETAELLALIHDFSLSAIRVGATTGVANRALAKKNSTIVGLFGSGNEARTNLEAICAVQPIDKVLVYSPTKEHRDRFAEEMTESLNVEVQPVTSARAVVKGADIVMCATNSSQAVFEGSWLEPGQLVVTIANSDGVHRRTEADVTTMTRSDLIVLNNIETAVNNQQRELLDLIDQEKVSWDKVCELGQARPGARRCSCRTKQRSGNHLLQEQHRGWHPVRRRRCADLRSLQETGLRTRAAWGMVRRGSQRMDG
ncbi:MAG: ornithine cyclodeaminase family protein [Deltaproteobacteria bacterium]|nr:MAG: ornithine cyclodeaminase family protein [Deltaproteobacteria bacterium]